MPDDDAEKDARMNHGIRRAFEMVRHMAAHPEAYPEDSIFIAADHVASVLTPERARIYNVVRERGSFESVGDLADALGRDRTRVGRDLSVLEGYGLVHLQRPPGGKVKRVLADHRPVLIL